MTHPPPRPNPYGSREPYGRLPPPRDQRVPPPWARQHHHEDQGYRPGDGYQPGPPRRRGRTIALIAAATVLVAAAGTGLYLLLDGDERAANEDTTDPRRVAERFGEVYRTLSTSPFGQVTPDDLDPLVCATEMGALRQEYRGEEERRRTGTSPEAPPLATVTVVIADLITEGDRGSFTLLLHGTGANGQTQSRDVRLRLTKEDGGWQVCGLTETASGSGAGASRPPSGTPTPPGR
jgi:hypothetical protein